MVATVPAEKLLTGRRPCCEQLDPPYDIKIVYVQKITFVLRKINRNCCTRAALVDSSMQQIVCRLAVFMGRCCKGMGEERRDGSEFVV